MTDTETPGELFPPSDATNVDVTLQYQTATVTWGPPEIDGGSPLIGYAITRSDSIQTVVVGVGARSTAFTGLPLRRQIRFAVQAVNSDGPSAYVWTDFVFPIEEEPTERPPDTNYASVKLDWNGQTLELSDCHQYLVTKFDPGFPEVRQVALENPDWDGITDETRFFGPRVITVTGIVNGNGVTRERLKARLGAFLHPTMRPTLTWQLDARDAPRTAVVRVADFDSPFIPGRQSDYQVSWMASDPFWYALYDVTINLSLAGGAIRGRIYDLTFDRRYPVSAGGQGLGVAYVEGSATPPHIKIFGHCVNPRVINQTTGQQLAFTGTIHAGEYLDIDGATHSITLNGDPNADRYYMLNFSQSQWFLLQPGENSLRFTADSVEGAATAVISWRSRDL